MKGWRTLAFNAGIIALVALGHWALGVNWADYVSPQWATVVMGAVNIVLRLVTTTAVPPLA